MKNHLYFIGTMALVISASAASSQEPLPTRRVFYGDLDLTSDMGRHVLDRRISGAISILCGAADSRDLAALSRQRTCASQTRDRVRPLVDLAMADANQRMRTIATTASRDVGR